MNENILSILVVLIFIGILIGSANLFVGLLILALFAPFFTILHEASPGSPIFFLWPFILCASMGASILFRESFSKKSLLPIRERRIFSVLAVAVIVSAVLTSIWIGTNAINILSDTQMGEFRKILTNQNLLLVSVLMSVCIFVFLAVYFSVMWRREGTWRLLDIVIAMLLAYGVFQIFYTAYESTVFFVGLDTFRYNFFMLIVYFISRYSIRSDFQIKWIVLMIGVASVFGAAQMLTESYMLNVALIPPQELPWVGHLTNNFGYAPESERVFFKGKFLPMGFMYMTHMSGMYLLLGIVLWLPRLIVIENWKSRLFYFIPFMLVISATFWTSRTVLLLLVFSVVVIFFLMEKSWVNSVFGVAGIMVFILLSSHTGIPGLRYEIDKEIKYIRSRAFVNLYNAFKVDMAKVMGIGEEKIKPDLDESPIGWNGINVSFDHHIPKKIQSSVKRIDDGKHPNSYTFKVTSVGNEGVNLRRVIENVRAYRAAEIRVGAWLKTSHNQAVRIVLDGYERTSKSDYHPGDGEWKFITLRHKLHPYAEKVNVNIKVPYTKVKRNIVFFVNGVFFCSPTSKFHLMSGIMKNPWEDNDPANGGTKVSRHCGWENGGVVEPRKIMHSLSRNRYYIFGRGGSFSGWATVFYPKIRASMSVFQHSTYSDMKYLEFMEQFGIIGLILLLLVGFIGILNGGRLYWKTNKNNRQLILGCTVVLLVAFVSMGHLPSLFRVGFNSTVYMVMAILVYESA